MKIITVGSERNFHILNDDRFIMEKNWLTAELAPGEDEQAALNELRSRIAANIRTAYPHVEEHLNFHVERQVRSNEQWGDVIGKSSHIIPEPYPFNNRVTITDTPPADMKPQPPLEDQILASKDIVELDSFKIIARMNPKLSKVYEAKYNELSKPKSKQKVQ